MNDRQTAFLVMMGVMLTVAISFAGGYLIGLQEDRESVKIVNSYDGCWASVKNNTLDKTTEWIAVDVTDMSLDRAYEVCRHEMAHVIYNGYCEQNESTMQDCIDATKGWRNKDGS